MPTIRTPSTLPLLKPLRLRLLSVLDPSPTIIQPMQSSQCSHVSLLPPRFPPATVPPGRLLRMFWALVVTLVVNVSMLNLTPSHSQYERLSGSTVRRKCRNAHPNQTSLNELTARLRRAGSPTRVSMKATNPFRLYLVIYIEVILRFEVYWGLGLGSSVPKDTESRRARPP